MDSAKSQEKDGPGCALQGRPWTHPARSAPGGAQAHPGLARQRAVSRGCCYRRRAEQGARAGSGAGRRATDCPRVSEESAPRLSCFAQDALPHPALAERRQSHKPSLSPAPGPRCEEVPWSPFALVTELPARARDQAGVRDDPQREAPGTERTPAPSESRP